MKKETLVFLAILFLGLLVLAVKVWGYDIQATAELKPGNSIEQEFMNAVQEMVKGLEPLHCAGYRMAVWLEKSGDEPAVIKVSVRCVREPKPDGPPAPPSTEDEKS